VPSLVQLEYIVAVAELRHFGKAAQACHISQPTLSQQIRKVEDDLNIVLFDRIKKPIMMTPEGAAFVEHARIIIREHKKLRELTKQKSEEISGPFHIGIIPTVSSTLVPHFIEHFAKTYPKVQLFIDELKTDLILEGLRHDKLDAAIMATPLAVEGLKEEPLYYEPFKIYASKGHSLLKKKTCTKTDLNGDGLWLLRDGHCFKDQVIRYCSLNNEAPELLRNIHFQSGSLDTLRRLIDQGHGYTLIPAFMISSMSSAEISAHIRPFSQPIPAREISLVTRRDLWKKKIAEGICKSILLNLPREVYKEKNNALEVLDVC
jgi:LysR family hydrogen peroxide-inducible transcriptional activator